MSVSQYPSSSIYVPLAGGTMTGPLVVTDPTTSHVPITINLPTSAAANGFEINSFGGSGGDLFAVDPQGNVVANGSGDFNTEISAEGASAIATLYSGSTKNSWRLALNNDSTFRILYSPNSFGSSSLNALTFDASANATLFGTLAMGSHKITGVTDPTNPQDAATKNYVDMQLANALPKNECQAATTTALAAATYNNGASGVGATLTLTVAAVLVLDGYTPVLNDRLLIKNQASAFQNGVYQISTLGTVLVNAVLTRTTDFDQPADGINGAQVYVLNGTANGNTLWFCTTSGSITFGTTNINWSEFLGSVYVGDGSTITITGTTISVAAGYVGQTSITTVGALSAGSLAAGFTAVAIAQGGTGQTTAAAAYNALSPMTTTGDIEYESAANTASRLAGNTTTTQKVLSSTGTGSAATAPVWSSWITATNGASHLGTNVECKTFTSFTATGLSISIPSAGVWWVTYDCNVDITASSAFSQILFQLFDFTNSAAISNSASASTYTSIASSQEHGGSNSRTVLITTTGAVTLNLQAKVFASGYSNATLNAGGYTSISFFRLA